jgi:D-glycero-D-manno-heptose 1,7-bisphosphate phosphatase
VIEHAQAVLLDRDGIITEPVLDPLTGTYESPLDAGDVHLVDDAVDAMRSLLRRDLKLLVVSNQPAAAKGIVSMAQLQAVHERTVELLAQQGIAVDGWHYCHHHPAGVVDALSGACECRKPGPGLLLSALRQCGTEPSQAWMVGDSDSDVAAGRAAGTRTVLVTHPLTAHRRGLDTPAPDLTVSNLLEFVESVFNGAGVA